MAEKQKKPKTHGKGYKREKDREKRRRKMLTKEKYGDKISLLSRPAEAGRQNPFSHFVTASPDRDA